MHATRKRLRRDGEDEAHGAHLEVLADDREHAGEDGDDLDGVGEEDVQRRTSTARGRFTAAPAILQEGNGEDEVQEGIDKCTVKRIGRWR